MQQLISSHFGSEQVEIIKLNGGASNYVFKVSPVLESKLSPVILRIFGSAENIMVDRELEHSVMTCLEKHNIAPKLLVEKDYGRIESTVMGSELDYKTCCDPEITYQLGFAINDLHQKLQPLNCKTKNFLIKCFKTFLKRTIMPEEIQKLVQQELIYLKKLDYKSGITHNDLTLGNIFINPENINFIDFEYVGYNFLSFDLANHINEREGVLLDKPPATHDEIINLISGYRANKSDEINQILIEVYNLIPTSHLLWTIWGLDMAKKTTIYFDYEEYSKKRLVRYFETIKKRILC